MTDPSMDQPYRYQYPQAPYGPPPPAYPVSGTPYQVSVTPYQPATGALQSAVITSPAHVLPEAKLRLAWLLSPEPTR